MNKIKVLSLFSGIGSFEQAMTNLDLDYEIVNFCEIDKYAIESYSLIHNIPIEKNLGDISKVDISKIPDFDLMTYGFPCFTGDMLVKTNVGMKKIVDIRKGDLVVTHGRNMQEVTFTGYKPNEGIYTVKSMCCPNIETTKDHPFYARKKNNGNLEHPVWVNAELLTNDYYIGSVIPKKETNRNDNLFSIEYSWFIGRIFNNNFKYNNLGVIESGVKITCLVDDKEEKKHISNILKILNISYSNIDVSGLTEFIIDDDWIYDSLKNITFTGETLPRDIWLEDYNNKKSFIDGFIDSFIIDGTALINDDMSYSIKFNSEILTYEISKLIEEVYCTPVIVENDNNMYIITFKKDVKTFKNAFYDDGYIWYPVINVKNEDYTDTVYNLTVGDDHSYTINGVIVKNCQDISIAGNKKGFIEDSGTRSSLLWQAMNVANKHKPKYMIAENVKNILSKSFKSDFDKWIKSLNKMGYVNYYKILNSKDFGIPQNRERVFVISIREDLNEYYTFPEKETVKIKLKDMLDVDVDDKYYIKDITLKDFKLFDKYTPCNDLTDSNVIIDAFPLTEQRTDNAKRMRRSNMLSGKDYCHRRDKDVVIKKNQCVGALTGSPTIEQSFIELKQLGVIGKDSESTRVYDVNGLSKTIKDGGGMGSKTGLYVDYNGIDVIGRVRRLTPKECWRLMGFSDEKHDLCMKHGISDTQRYKQAGNSIVVNVLEKILYNLLVEQPNTIMNFLK